MGGALKAHYAERWTEFCQVKKEVAYGNDWYSYIFC